MEETLPISYPNAVIIASKQSPIPWNKKMDSSQSHKVGCVIIEYSYKKYVLSVRADLIYYQEFYLFYSVENQVIYRNKLYILFQSIESQIVILASVGYQYLNINESELVCQLSSSKHVNNKIQFITIPSKFFMPARNRTYLTRNANILSSDAHVKYTHTNCHVTYLKSYVETRTYLPPTFFLVFKSKSSIHLRGDFVWDNSNVNDSIQLCVGLIVAIDQNNLIVLPMKQINKVLMTFVNSTNSVADRIKNLNPICDNLTFTIVKNQVMNSENEQVISIDNNKISVKKQQILIYDHDYGKKIPLDIYTRENFNPDQEINICVKKVNSEKIFHKVFFLKKYIKKSLPLTDQPDFNPAVSVPYFNLHGFIIVRLTHELLDILFSRNIQPNLYVVNDILNNKPAAYDNTFIIIDCLNSKLMKKLGLTRNNFVLLEINDNKINNLDSISEYVKKNNTLKISDSPDFSFNIQF